MKLLPLLLLSGTLLFATPVTIDYDKSAIKFQVSNMWLNKVFGTFRNFKTTIDYDTKTHHIRTLNATIDATSIFTDNATRDTSLVSADYLKTDYFPQISFEMQEVFNNHIVGYLTILNNKRPISMAIKKFEATEQVFRLDLEGELNRNEFGVDKSPHFLIGKMVSFTVTLTGKLDAKYQTPPAKTPATSAR